MNLVGGNILVFEVGLYIRHEARWSTQEVVSIYILDQVRQERAVYAALAIIVLCDPILGAGPALGDVHVNVRTIRYQITDLIRERMMKSVARAVNEPDRPLAVLTRHGVKDAHQEG